MKRLSRILISGLILFNSLVSCTFAGDILMEGEKAPFDGFLFKRDELDKFQFIKHEKDLLEAQFTERLAEYRKPRSSTQAALFSFVLPGTGQLFYSEEVTKGKVMLGTEVVLALGALYYGYDATEKYSAYSKSQKAADFNVATDSENMRNMFFYGMVGLGVYSATDAWIGVKRYNNKLEAEKKESISLHLDGDKLALKYTMRFK